MLVAEPRGLRRGMLYASSNEERTCKKGSMDACHGATSLLVMCRIISVCGKKIDGDETSDSKGVVRIFAWVQVGALKPGPERRGTKEQGGTPESPANSERDLELKMMRIGSSWPVRWTPCCRKSLVPYRPGVSELVGFVEDARRQTPDGTMWVWGRSELRSAME